LSENSVILVAGGTGTRMNTSVPKQFLLLAGQPILMCTINVFHQFDPAMQVCIALPEPYILYWELLCLEYSFTIPHQLVKGGDTRFGSVKNALELINGNGLVAIHDGVRPLVSVGTLRHTFEEAAKTGNAIPVIHMQESVRETGTDGNKEVPRENLRIVQTPQVFRKELIKKAYSSAPHLSFTDDATVLETLGETIHLVEGNIENIKITHPFDLHYAEAILGSSSNLKDPLLSAF
jgi:2-C-methyl-D-erythritol 4-phosphate cytidylyltransferase